MDEYATGFLIRSVLRATSAIALQAVVTVAQIVPAEDAPQPLTHEESASHVRVPEGFRLDIVASEPVIEEPSCVAFDERGLHPSARCLGVVAR